MDVICYYYQPTKVPLLREAVLPVARDLAGAGMSVHVERHWLYGPHLRLRIDGPDAQAHADAAAERLRQYLIDRPSVHRVDAGALLADAEAAGHAELVPPPYGPLRPDNTVRVEPNDDSRTRALLHDDGVEARTRLLRLGVPALRATVDFLGAHGDSGPARLQVALAAMTAHAAALPTVGVTGGYHSYISHLEDFLVNNDPDGRLAETFADRWEQHADQVTGLVARICEGRLRPWEELWSQWSRVAWRFVDERRRAGAQLTGGGGRRRAVFSEYHQMMHRADPEGTMRVRPDALVYRWCTNVLYLLLAVCDLRPLERYLAAYLVTRAVPELTGHSWRAEMADAIARRERV
jgi:hypothetical protein